MKRMLWLTLISLSAMASTTDKPKYGPEATLLSQSHEFIQKSPAPDYWALSPYYVGQQTDSACSLATVTMVVNAARSGQKLKADEELVTQASLLKTLKDSDFEKRVAQEGAGVHLAQMKGVLEKSLKAYGFSKVKISEVTTSEPNAETLKELRAALKANEKSAKDFIVANFVQGVLTGDTPVGHYAVVGAYDSTRQKVLIMDPDRKWYEPYWVSDETLLKAMATKDSETGSSRGYLLVRLVGT